MEGPQDRQPFIHNFKPPENESQFFSKVTLLASIIIILSGIATGYLLSSGGGTKTLPGDATNSSDIKEGQVFGSEDTKTFRDSAQGTLEKGGVFGEGSHRLIREGGESQTAALTSSIVNLDQFVEKKVKVWGETQKGQKAGWLMDVGRLEVLE